MAKVSGAYKSLVRGVSQQVPEERLPGQHEEQVNIISDPVRGLVRRQGTIFIRENPLDVAPANVAAWQQDLAKNFSSRDFVLDTREFTLHARRPGQTGPADPFFLMERGGTLDGIRIPTIITSGARTLLAGGVVGQAVVGRYLLLAHGEPITATAVEQWDTDANKRLGYVQVRQGNYSRTYTVRLKVVGVSEIVASYTTPSASFPGVLDTSDIPASATDYQKRVNDRVNAYQGQVTAWLGTAAAAIQPQAIAASLVTALNAAGAGTALGQAVTSSGAVINLSALSPMVVEYIRVDDGGNGETMRATHQTLEDAAQVPPLAVVGHTVRIQPKNDGEVYYLKAAGAGTGLRPVVWREAPSATGVLTSPFVICALHGGTLFAAESPTALQTALNAVSAGITVPLLGERGSGDEDTNPIPYFGGRRVTAMGVFQDRLWLASGPVVNFSRIGDYFNFFRATVLTSKDADPVEIYSTGTEDDIIRHGVFFDRNLILFGEKQQYPLNGKVPLTPATATMIQSSSHKDAVSVRPISQGDLVFYAKVEDGSVNLYQIAVGNVEDTTNSTEVSQQLDTYIQGQPLDLLGLSMPDTVIVRTAGNPNGFYVLRYLDAQSGERVLESWGRWSFDAALGPVVGVGAINDRLRITYARTNEAGTALFLAVDEALMVPGQYLRPHLDSLRPAAIGTASPAWRAMWGAYGADTISTRRWQGVRSNNLADLFGAVGEDASCWVGTPFGAYCTLTSPYPRDSSDAVITIGRTTVNRLVISFANTGAFGVTVDSPYEQETVLEFRGNVVGADVNRVGEITLQRGVQSAAIGREVREYAASIVAVDWFPMSINAIDWVGQYFNSTRRV